MRTASDGVGLPVIVGEGPSRTGDRYWRFPLSGAPARTLCGCAGWEPHGPASEPGSWTWALYSRFHATNVFQRYADSAPWSAPAARERAGAIYDDAVKDKVSLVVLLGRRVADAFGVTADYGEFVVLPLPATATRHGPRMVTVVLPHPSGRNRLMNDPVMRERVGSALRWAVVAGSAANPSKKS